jgi:hypothetical protein
MCLRVLFTVVILFFVRTVNAQFYYGSQLEFGKNRIQFDKEVWSHYKYEKFDIYFYLGGKNIALYAAQIAEQQIQNLELMLDYQLEDEIQFIIYNKQSDFKQSNLGLSAGNETNNIGGTARIVGSKVILYYEGDHDKFIKQVRAGIAEVAFNQMMYGGSWKEVVRNSTLLTIPEWYIEGFASYFSSPWNTEIENYIKDGIKSNRFNQLHRLTGNDARYAGHSVWNYIAETYGKNVIPNILYMTRISRNIESGFLFVVGISLKNLVKEWKLFYANKFYDSDVNRVFPDKESNILQHKQIKKGSVVTQFKLNQQGDKAIYCLNTMGQYKIYLFDINTQKKQLVYKREHKLNRITDYSYPLINWHPSGQLFTFITEEEGKIWMHYYNLEEKKLDKRPILNFEKIISYQYAPDGKKFVMSAVQNGFTDIYVFNVASNSPEQITKDVYDDLHPTFFKGTQQIIFSSNRNNDTLKWSDDVFPVKPFYDLFVYDYVKKTPILRRLTETDFINETQPLPYDNEHIVFLSDQNGIVNRMAGIMDSTLAFVDTSEHYRYTLSAFPITNNARNIIQHQTSDKTDYIADLQLSEGRYKMLRYNKIPFQKLEPVSLRNTPYRQLSNSTIIKTEESSEKKQLSEEVKKEPIKSISLDTAISSTTMFNNSIDTTNKNKIRTFEKVSVFSNEKEVNQEEKVDVNNYVFENETAVKSANKNLSAPSPQPLDTANEKIKQTTDKTFKIPKTRNYNRFFTVDYFVTQLDNSFLSANYQLFTNTGGPIYYNPGFNGLIKVGSSDLFEDYRISGGFRLSTDFKSNEFLVSVEDLSNRWDKQLVLHRRSINTADNDNQNPWIKVYTHEAKYIIKYPFNEVLAWRGATSVRQDNTVFQSSNDFNLKKPNIYNYWVSLKSDLTFDNSLSLGINLPVGLKYKLFTEYYKQLNEPKINTYIVGGDLRYYLKIHREFIWANRVAASTSFGNKRLIYYLGGVDNWFFPKYHSDVQVKQPEQYIFQTLATNMRGFAQNVRNGNSFAVINSELRFPIFKYLSERPLRSEFLNNFQLIGFTDVGTAWVGKSPFSEDNSLFTTVIKEPNNPIEITLKNRLNPVVGGYGWGVRSKVLGYFVRLDWARGVQDGIILKRIFYLSLSTDF